MSLVAELHSSMRLPIIAAPMFLISGPDLVIAAGKAGILGAFPAPNARIIADLEQWLPRISGELAAAGRQGMWAINMIVHSTYERFDAELDLICEYKPRLVITALGNPARPLERVHAYGGAVFSDVITPLQARKAVDAGADGLILVTNGAGGHTGQYNPFALVEEVRSFWDGPLILGGAIGGARGVRAALALGADFAYMGTRFIATRESMVSDPNREMLVRSQMEDIVMTTAVTGVPSNWMRESLDAAGFTPEMLEIKKKIDFSNLHGDSKAWKNIWGAGHAVGQTRSIQTAAEVVNQLCDDYTALGKDLNDLGAWPRTLT
ncbi:2-nitropropane dioxygenase NPD [Sphingobium chlorophenolicum L-1]|uniref:2-nitropropane dioxygenase NPD n=1 Tax=Sphingobium chlorophenolicum L-1 TaxID=690566 RepID=F6F3M3_SPHCR|nr:nitronate monooxygenase [Sphingobium chlorophenolicum]AEG51035.1 2-nitropropane dioxygenase NPD [Sphingobium chlorophenolicum L-1]